MNIDIKYGSELVKINVPDEQLMGIYKPRDFPAVNDLETAVRRSLDNPIGSLGLSKIAQGRHNAVIVVDDATRTVPSADLLVPIVDVLCSAGIQDENICVIVATGLHRPMSQNELDKVLGPLKDRIKIINHDCEKQLKFLGKTKLGTEIHLNKTFMEADIKILTGDVEFHQFCGYGGGAKSIHPGLADKNSITLTHSRMEMEGTGPGRIEGNPVREDINEVGRLTGVDFIVNVVLNAKKEVVKVFSGNVDKAFLAGARVCNDIYSVEVPRRVDVVVVSCGGYPKDIELYQAQKAIQSAVRIVKPNGKIIAFAECREGHGSPLAYQWACNANSLDDLFTRIKDKFVMGGHKAYQLAMAAKWADVYLYSGIDPNIVEKFFLRPLSNVGEIEKLIKEDESVAVMPDATLTVAKIHNESEQSGFGLPNSDSN